MSRSKRERPPIRRQLQDLAYEVSRFADLLRRAHDSIANAAARHWPEPPAYTVEWHDREQTPPAGRIWASDGESIWIIWTDGKGIGAQATAVRFWTQALIPAPPRRPDPP